MRPTRVEKSHLKNANHCTRIIHEKKKVCTLQRPVSTVSRAPRQWLPHTGQKRCTHRDPVPTIVPEFWAWVLDKRVCSYQSPASTVVGYRVWVPNFNAQKGVKTIEKWSIPGFQSQLVWSGHRVDIRNSLSLPGRRKRGRGRGREKSTKGNPNPNPNPFLFSIPPYPLRA